MGWKAIRDHYRIGHIVHVREGDVLIGSPMVSQLVTIRPDGTIVPNSIVRNDGVLNRYMDEMREDVPKLLDLMHSEDVFDASIPVFTWEGADIVEDACEEFGWPNVTHSGALMYENTFFLDRSDAVRKAFSSARYRIDAWGEHVEEARKSLIEKEKRLSGVQDDLARLTAEHPAIAAEAVEE